MAIILIVDDNFANREYLATLLKYSRNEVIEAANGLQALEFACHKKPDLIITDLVMPMMDGEELVAKIKQIPALSKIPIIFFSAVYKEETVKSIAKVMGVKYMLTKPCEPQILIDTVHEALYSQTVLNRDKNFHSTNSTITNAKNIKKTP